MAAKFKAGDLVELRSGGPVMTVERVSESFEMDDVWSYGCTWFAGDKHQHSSFTEAALKGAEDDD